MSNNVTLTLTVAEAQALLDSIAWEVDTPEEVLRAASKLRTVLPNGGWPAAMCLICEVRKAAACSDVCEGCADSASRIR